MPKLTITNQIHIPYVNDELDNFVYSSLTITNPKWIENQRLGRWNRDTDKELFFYDEYDNKDKVELYAPRGFLTDILEYCKKENIDIKINNKTVQFNPIDFKFHGDLKSFQKIAVKKMLSQNEGVLCAPTGSGKTVMALYIISQRKQPTIIIVHTKELLYQWAERIKKFLKLKDRQIGFVGDGKLEDDKDITIALIQTLSKYPEIVNEHGFMIVDECHRVPAKVFSDAAKEFEGRYILGLSATPYRRDGLTKCIEWYAGPILHKIETDELIEKKHITGIEPVIRRTNFNSMLEDPSADYSTLLLEISQDKDRNEMIVNDISIEYHNGETCLVLSDRKVHCQILHDMLRDKKGLESTVLTGDVKDDERKKIVEDVNAGKIKILIATGQLIGEGFDCENLSAIFLTMPIRFSGRVIQYIGRVLRPMKGKDKALVYDFFDQWIRCLYSGFKARKKEYEKLMR